MSQTINVCPLCGKAISRRSKHCKGCFRTVQTEDYRLERAITRFKARIVKLDIGCWVLRGLESGPGYPYVHFQGADHGAHRVALFVFEGLSLDTPLDAMHSCDNPRCVNPGHLDYGTRTENMQDAKAKGRTRNVSDWSGLNNPKSKISPSDHPDIVSLAAAGIPRKVIAAQYGIGYNRVCQILGSR